MIGDITGTEAKCFDVPGDVGDGFCSKKFLRLVGAVKRQGHVDFHNGLSPVIKCDGLL